ncbi:MAG: hypothetical protein MJZ57_02055 [Bacteroidales bacterium]|nr:hypothetical protein [Bacteroidales bacterium]
MKLFHKPASIDCHAHAGTVDACCFLSLKTILVMLFCMLTATLFAQQGKAIQLEFPPTQYTTKLTQIPCDTNGLCVLYPSSENEPFLLNIEHYNINLQPVHKTAFPIPTAHEYIGATYHNGIVYVLYQRKDKKKKDDNGLVLCYECRTQTLDTFFVANLPTVNNITRLTAHNHHLFFTCDLNKENENLYFLNITKKFAKALYLNSSIRYTINDYLIDSVYQRVIICVNSASHTRNNTLLMCETDFEGNVQYAIPFPDTNEYRFQNARVEQMDSDKFFIGGTYQDRKITISNSATGMYTTIYDGGMFTHTNLIPYSGDTYHFDFYDRTETMFISGKIYHDSTRYAFITEAFYPEYRYSTTYSYGMPSTDAIFYGYHFQSAQVRIFDTTGTLTWAYDFPFDRNLVSNLSPHLKISFLPNNVLFYYQFGQDLYTMLTDNDMEIVDPIRKSSFYPDEQYSNQTRYTSAFMKWYGPYYLLYGYRFAKRSNNKAKSPTYFLYKMKYQ